MARRAVLEGGSSGRRRLGQQSPSCRMIFLAKRADIECRCCQVGDVGKDLVQIVGITYCSFLCLL